MSNTELRNIIINHLSQIEDQSFLNALKTIIESKVHEDIYELNDQQKSRLEKARKNIKDGNTISHDDLQKEIDQWLNTR
ncbi:MAG: hypothetical protein K9I74_10890 [Bacteroidales bacterium]|nr:hypothetical protein [Bacteroidales bacterium]